MSGIYKNSVINGLGILFTAVIQTVQGKLDLYHAIVVMYILFFFNIVFLFGMYLQSLRPILCQRQGDCDLASSYNDLVLRRRNTLFFADIRFSHPCPS